MPLPNRMWGNTVKPRRPGRVLRWVGLGVCVSIAAIWIAAQWRTFVFTTGMGLDISIAGGYLMVDRTDTPPYAPLSFDVMPLPPTTTALARLGVDPHYVETPFSGTRHFLNLWILLALSGLTTAGLWFLARPPASGFCPHCGYNLTGNTAGRCPECGASFADQETQA